MPQIVLCPAQLCPHNPGLSALEEDEPNNQRISFDALPRARSLNAKESLWGLRDGSVRRAITRPSSWRFIFSKTHPVNPVRKLTHHR
jgi:hypothetical protein